MMTFQHRHPACTAVLMRQAELKMSEEDFSRKREEGAAAKFIAICGLIQPFDSSAQSSGTLRYRLTSLADTGGALLPHAPRR